MYSFIFCFSYCGPSGDDMGGSDGPGDGEDEGIPFSFAFNASNRVLMNDASAPSSAAFLYASCASLV